MNPDSLRMVNCAQCGLEMLGESDAHWAESLKLPRVRGRVLGRPYCGPCLTVRRPPQSTATSDPDGATPGQENAIRALEDLDRD